MIVSMHAGVEYQKQPNAEQRRFAHAAIDAGASVVVGAHPHVTQPVESYRDGVIFYSLGNLVFDQFQRQETQHGLIADLHFTGGKIVVLQHHSGRHREHRPARRRSQPIPALMTALVLSAGGMYGAYQAGAWKAIADVISARPGGRRFHRRPQRLGHRRRLRSRRTGRALAEPGLRRPLSLEVPAQLRCTASSTPRRSSVPSATSTNPISRARISPWWSPI